MTEFESTNISLPVISVLQHTAGCRRVHPGSEPLLWSVPV